MSLRDLDNYLEKKQRRERRGRFTGLGIFCLVVGAVLFGAGWYTGSRGGIIYFDDGIHVTSLQQIQPETGEPHAITSTASALNLQALAYHVIILPHQAQHIAVDLPHHNIYIEETRGTLYIRTQSDETYGVNLGFNLFARNNITNFGFMGRNHNLYSLTPTLGRHQGNWSVTYNFDFANFSFNQALNTITIHVPQNLDSIHIATTVGNINMQHVNLQNLHLTTTTGNIVATNTNAHTAGLQTTVGNIMVLGNFATQLQARTTTGSIDAWAGTDDTPYTTVDLQATTGAVHFATNGSAGDFMYNLTATVGRINIDGQRQSGRSATGGAGTRSINAHATTGSVNINFGTN